MSEAKTKSEEAAQEVMVNFAELIALAEQNALAAAKAVTTAAANDAESIEVDRAILDLGTALATLDFIQNGARTLMNRQAPQKDPKEKK